MNLEFENLAEWGSLSRKLKNWNRHVFFGKPSQDEIQGWQLQQFTVDKQSREESKRNFQKVLEKAQEIEAPILVIRPNEIQFIGTEYGDAYIGLSDDDWIQRLREYYENRQRYFSKPFWTQEISDLDLHTFSLSVWGTDAVFARSPQTGFYDVKTGKKITDRKKQIQTLWDLGWAAKRGRPVGVGYQRHSGSREDIALITNQANSMWNRQHESEIAAKVCSIYRSVNRYYAWPGSW